MSERHRGSPAPLSAFEHGPHDDAPFVALHERFSRSAAATPDRIAAVFGEIGTTYADLDRASSVFAARLIEAGVGAGDLVPILLPRSLELLAAILGVLKAGAAYVPIDARFPAARVALILRDCGARLVVTNTNTPLSPIRIAWIDLIDTRAAHTVAIPHRPVGPRSPIYVIYTSGTTGQPKGIVQNHGALSNLIQWQATKSGIDLSGAVLQFSSISFDVHLQEMFGAWTAGGTVCVIDDEVRLDRDLLIETIEKHRIRTLFLSVSALRNLVLSEDGTERLPEVVTHIVTAGEQLYVNAPLRRLLARRPHLTLHNHYGVSESHVVTALSVHGDDPTVPERAPVGRPISNSRVFILDEHRVPVGVGEAGEIWISGACLATSYLGRPDLDSQYYFDLDGDGTVAYKTRDLGKWHEDGAIEFLGRIDTQLKISGSLVEPGDIEWTVRSFPGAGDCAVVGFEDGQERYLAAFVIAAPSFDVAGLRKHLSLHLPPFMIPRLIVPSTSFPIAGTGKIDRTALARQAASLVGRIESESEGQNVRERPPEEPRFVASGPFADTVHRVMRDALGLRSLPPDANFFDVGANSLLLMKAARALSAELDRKLSPLVLFQHPSTSALVQFLAADSASSASPPSSRTRHGRAPGVTDEQVAVIGMAGRFPGAPSVEALWALLMEGRSGLIDIEPGVEERNWLQPGTSDHDGYVRRAGAIADYTRFDAEFFGISHAEAALMDPQHRVFLEECAHALEDAGCVVGDTRHRVGVFAGCDVPSYLCHVQPRIGSMTEYLRALVANDKDFLATRVAYELDLRGPAVTVQSACSTSLVAIHAAVQAILGGDCDIALAGASSVAVPQMVGYVADEGGVYSHDGEMRPFDADAHGILISNGVAIVCLKRLSDAIADGDRIYAVVQGSAINNDGARKVGYAAPSAAGQLDVVNRAIERSGVDPASIVCIEAHGTGTVIGDPIEVHALTEAYRRHTADVGYCALGSLKGNIGHLNRAAGVAGFIKAVLSVYHGICPPTIHCDRVNPLLELERSPFFVPREPTILERRHAQRLHAAVSAFGIGGTNAHVILSEPPLRTGCGAQPSRAASSVEGVRTPAVRFLPVSAKSETALHALCSKLGDADLGAFDADRCDAGFTLARARAHYAWRRCDIASDRREWTSQLRGTSRAAHATGECRQVAFLFPGQTPIPADALVEAVRDLPMLGAELDRFGAFAEEVTGLERGSIVATLTKTSAAIGDRPLPLALLHTALVVQQRALAELWTNLGVRPAYVGGYSLGECTAAALAGALSDADLFRLVHARATFMADTPAMGALLSVFLSRESIAPYLDAEIRPAIFASRSTTIVAGPHFAIGELCSTLDAAGIGYRPMTNERLNHTPAMRGVEPRLRELLNQIVLHPLRTPLASNELGMMLATGTTLDREFFVTQVWHPVHFDRCVDALSNAGADAYVEMDAVGSLGRFVRQQIGASASSVAIASVSASASTSATEPGAHVVAGAISRFWESGGTIEWSALYPDGSGAKTSLPGYPFAGREYWIPFTNHADDNASSKSSPPAKMSRLFRTRWERVPMPMAFEPGDLREKVTDVVVLYDDRSEQHANELYAALDREQLACRRIRLAEAAARFERIDRRDDRRGDIPCDVIVLCNRRADDATAMRGGEDGGDAWDAQVFGAVQAFEKHVASADSQVRYLFAAGTADALPDVIALPDVEDVQTLALILPRERTNRTVRLVCHAPTAARDVMALVMSELAHGEETGCRWYSSDSCRQAVQRPTSEPGGDELPAIDGALVIVGGLGNVGRVVVPELLKRVGVPIVLIGRTNLDRDSAAADRRRAALSALRQAAGSIPVIYFTADAADEHALERAVRAAEAEVGRIAAVLHLAAHIEDETFLCSLDELTASDVASSLRPKVSVVDAIERVCDRRRIGVKVLFSSVSVLLGGVGYFPYVLANLRAESAARRRTSAPWTIVHWDVWGVAVEAAAADADRVRLGSSATGIQLDAADAVRRLLMVLSSGIRECAVSRRDLTTAAESAWSSAPPTSETSETSDRPASEPREDTLDRHLRGVWAEVLGTEGFADDASFSELGGDSLAAVQVMLRLNRRYSYSVPIRLMMGSRSFREFRDRVRQCLAQPARPAARLMPQASQEAVLTPWEERWIQMAPRGFGYLDMPVVVSPRLDLQRFARALQTVVRRHSALRTHYPFRDGAYRREIRNDVNVTLHVHDHTPPSGDACSAAGIVERVAHAAACRRFDLTCEPPLEAHAAQIDAARTLWWIRTHHVAFDGWSSTILLDDLKAAYASADSDDGGARPQPQPLQYSDFAHWYEAFRQSPPFEAAKAYWLKVTRDGLPILELPRMAATLIASRDAAESLPAARRHFVIDGRLMADVRAFCARRGETIFHAIASCYALLLHEVCGTDTVVFGTTSAGRMAPGAEEVVGVFVNPMPLRITVHQDAAVGDLLADMSRILQNFHQHQLYPLLDLWRDNPLLRARDVNALFDAYLLYQNYPKSAAAESDRHQHHVVEPDDYPDCPEFHYLAHESPALMRELEMIVFEKGDRLSVNLWFRKSLFSAETVSTWAARFEQLLARLVSLPEHTPLSELRAPRLVVAERHGKTA